MPRQIKVEKDRAKRDQDKVITVTDTPVVETRYTLAQVQQELQMAKDEQARAKARVDGLQARVQEFSDALSANTPSA